MVIAADHFEGGQNTEKGTRKGSSPILGELVAATQQDLRNIAGLRGLAALTAAATTAVAAATATDEGTLVTMVNEEKGDLNALIALAADVRTQLVKLTPFAGLALVADPVGKADAADSDTAVPLVNAVKASYNVLQVFAQDLKTKLNADATIAITSADTSTEATADATDEASAITLANAQKTKINALRTLLEEVRTDYNAVAGKVTLTAADL